MIIVDDNVQTIRILAITNMHFVVHIQSSWLVQSHWYFVSGGIVDLVSVW